MKKILFFVLLIFMMCNVTKANETTLIKDKFDNTHTYYYDSNQGRYRYLLTSKYIFEDSVAYCIELGKPIDSFNYVFSSSFDGSNLSKEDIDYIKLAAYYGYNYPGHESDNYYLATQDIIWKRLSNVSVKYIRNMNPNNYIDVSKEKEDILLLMSKHNIKPSFYGSEINIIRGKEYVLEDTNDVLGNYSINNDFTYYDGNKLIIQDKFYDDSITLFRLNYTDRQFFLYSSGGNQKMMSAGSLDDESFEIKLNFIEGSIRLKKLDKETGDTPLGDATLNGAVYDLYDSDMNYIGSFVTGKNDTISGLPIGHYYIKERIASEGYMLDLNTYEVTINENNLNKEITVYEDIIKRKVDIFKVFDNGGTGILTTEEGVIFDVYDSSDNKVGSITTDSDGYASIVLPYGAYTFKQVTSTKDYYKVDNFKVIIDKYDTRPIYKLLSDSEITARVKIIKKDFDTLDNIVNSDIKFKIYDVREKKYVSFNVTYPEVNTIDTFSLSSNGEFITPDVLHSGEYILYEVDQKMNGYLYNKDGVHFYIGEESNFINDENYGVILEIPFYNKIVKGKIIINKYGENANYVDNSYYYKNIMLSDVYFELYAKDDIYENDKLIYEKDTLVDTIITDSKGRGVRDNLPLGKYYLKEIKSNNDNVFDDTIYDIELEYKDQYTEKINYEIDINNYLNKGKVIIHKLDTKNKEVIANTLIEIRNKDNVIVSLTADDEGYDCFAKALSAKSCNIKDEHFNTAVRSFTPVNVKTGYTSASQVQYVARCGNFVKDGYKYTGALKVLKVIFSYDYLWINVRVKGGAYGCMSGSSRNGDFYMVSYRDPNLEKTNDIYEGAADYIRNFDVSRRDMVKFIIGTIGEIDAPLTPSAMGSRSFTHYMCNCTEDMLRKDREEVLDATVESIRELAPLIESAVGQNYFCVVGNQKQINEAADLFDEIKPLIG